MEAELPTYKNPPLVEVAMSVQTEPIKGLSAAHLGAFWTTQRDQFPNVRAVQPIPPFSPDLSGQWLPPSIQFALSNDPDCRLQMTSQDEEWMLQCQRDRIVVNWRKQKGEYPRYDVTLQRLVTSWTAWTDLIATYIPHKPRARAWELTYVNRIPKETLWSSPAEWPQIFPGLWPGPFPSASGLRFRGLQSQWVFGSSEERASLFIETRPARLEEEFLIVNLTARGPLEVSDTTAFGPIENGLNAGHRLIVTAFDSIASEAAKIYWGRNVHT